jgi:hypothetical protein
VDAWLCSQVQHLVHLRGGLAGCSSVRHGEPRRDAQRGVKQIALLTLQMIVHVECKLIHGCRRAGRKKPAILKWLDPQEARTMRTVSESSIDERGPSE